MRQIASIGEAFTDIAYIDRPTVKVVIRHDDKILILNNGLLPGGGVEEGETISDSIKRELQEEIGAIVSNVKEIGLVEQFRSFLKKRYLVYGYSAEFVAFTHTPKPQDIGEANFEKNWVTTEEVLRMIATSIEELQVSTQNFESDATQGKLYNLMTSFEIIKALAD